MSKNNQFFCHYCGKNKNINEKTREHIIPESIGGTLNLSLPVCKDCNSTMGSKVDKPMVDHLFSISERAKHKIKSKTGKVPNLDFGKGILTQTDDLVFVKFTKYGLEMKFKPETKYNWEKGIIYIKADISDILPTLKNIYKRHKEKFKKKEIKEIKFNALSTTKDSKLDVKKEVGKIQEQLEKMGQKTNVLDVRHTILPKPEVKHTFSLGLNDFDRGIVKIALGFSIFILEDEFSNSDDAKKMRAFIFEDNPDKREEVGLIGQVFPNLESDETFEFIFVEEKKHSLVLINVGTFIACYIVLFGKFHNMVRITDEVGKYQKILGAGKVLLMDFKEKDVQIFELIPFIYSKLGKESKNNKSEI